MWFNGRAISAHDAVTWLRRGHVQPQRDHLSRLSAAVAVLATELLCGDAVLTK